MRVVDSSGRLKIVTTSALDDVWDFRLSLATATPIVSSDQSGKSTIYLCQYGGNRMMLYDGTNWRLVNSAELSLALGSSLVPYQAYDLFVDWNGGTPQLTKVEWANHTVTFAGGGSPNVVWTGHGMVVGNSVTFTNSGGGVPAAISVNTQYFVAAVVDANTFKIASSRTNVAAGTFINMATTGTGTTTGHQPQARATNLILQDGVWVLTGTLTSRYVGTFMADTTTTTSTVFGGTVNQTGGKWLLWNYYNQKPVTMAVFDSTDSWNYGVSVGAWRCANQVEANHLEFVIGQPASDVLASVVGLGQYGSGTGSAAGGPGIGLDAVTTLIGPPTYPTALHNEINQPSTAAFPVACQCNWAGPVANVGWHAFYWIEYSRFNTISFFGDGGVVDAQAGMQVRIFA